MVWTPGSSSEPSLGPGPRGYLSPQCLTGARKFPSPKPHSLRTPPASSSGTRADDKLGHCPPIHPVVSGRLHWPHVSPGHHFCPSPLSVPTPDLRASWNSPFALLGPRPPWEQTCPHTCAHPRLDPSLPLPAHHGSECPAHSSECSQLSTAFGHSVLSEQTVTMDAPNSTFPSGTTSMPGPAVRAHGLVGSSLGTQRPSVMVRAMMGAHQGLGEP